MNSPSTPRPPGASPPHSPNSPKRSDPRPWQDPPCSPIPLCNSALALAQPLGDLHRIAALHSRLADLLHAAGQEDEALEQLKQSAAAFAGVVGAEERPQVWTLTEW
jgi:hypothetical protein